MPFANGREQSGLNRDRERNYTADRTIFDVGEYGPSSGKSNRREGLSVLSIWPGGGRRDGARTRARRQVLVSEGVFQLRHGRLLREGMEQEIAPSEQVIGANPRLNMRRNAPAAVGRAPARIR
jgi:hypothetical protein